MQPAIDASVCFVKRYDKKYTRECTIACGKEESRVMRNAMVLTGRCEIRYPRNVYKGYPGGCATPNVYAAVRRSPASPAQI
jgi:hypothetical protein